MMMCRGDSDPDTEHVCGWLLDSTQSIRVAPGSDAPLIEQPSHRTSQADEFEVALKVPQSYSHEYVSPKR
jgi:hypothetical protein